MWEFELDVGLACVVRLLSRLMDFIVFGHNVPK